MTDRKKPGVAFWSTVVLAVVLVGYPLSFGPACWIAISYPAIVKPVGYLYWPLTRIAWACPGDFAVEMLGNYALWRQPGYAVKPVATIMMLSNQR